MGERICVLSFTPLSNCFNLVDGTSAMTMLRATPTLMRSSLSSTRRMMSRRPIVGGNWKCNPASASKLPELIANINACDTAK